MGRKQFTHCACKGCDHCTPCTGCDRCTTLNVPWGHCSGVRGKHGAKCRACTPRWWSLKSDFAQPPAPAVLGASFFGASATAPVHTYVPALVPGGPAGFNAAWPFANNALAHAVPLVDSASAPDDAHVPAATLAATSATLHVAAITLDPAPPDSAAMLNSLAAVAAMLPRAIDPNEGRKVGEG